MFNVDTVLSTDDPARTEESHDHEVDGPGGPERANGIRWSGGDCTSDVWRRPTGSRWCGATVQADLVSNPWQ